MKPVNPEKFGLTLRSIIERNDPHLAAFLGISTGYHKRKEEEEAALEEMKKSMLEKTEALRQRNMSQKEFRERNVLRGLRPDGGGFLMGIHTTKVGSTEMAKALGISLTRLRHFRRIINLLMALITTLWQLEKMPAVKE